MIVASVTERLMNNVMKLLLVLFVLSIPTAESSSNKMMICLAGKERESDSSMYKSRIEGWRRRG
jgi:PhoPQ-activated pathogenicity-related protein